MKPGLSCTKIKRYQIFDDIQISVYASVLSTFHLFTFWMEGEMRYTSIVPLSYHCRIEFVTNLLDSVTIVLR